MKRAAAMMLAIILAAGSVSAQTAATAVAEDFKPSSVFSYGVAAALGKLLIRCTDVVSRLPIAQFSRP